MSVLDVSLSRHKLQTTPLPPPLLGYHNNNQVQLNLYIESHNFLDCTSTALKVVIQSDMKLGMLSAKYG